MKIFILAVCLLTVAQSGYCKLQCYQCARVTEGCTVKEASAVPCSGDMPQCAKQIKIGDTDVSKAIRKCVLPLGKEKQVPCPDGFQCFNCDGELCNSAPQIGFARLGLLAAVFALLLPRFIVS